MTLEALVAEVFEKRQHAWVVDGDLIVPNEEDIMRALDEVARLLHNEEVGARLDVGGLIVDKSTAGHDVYVYVGSYQ